jgi:plastocyanin
MRRGRPKGWDAMRKAKVLIVVAALVSILFAPTASGGGTHVDILDAAFSPDVVTVFTQGGAVNWDSVSTLNHQISSDGYDGTVGPKLWQTGVLAPDQQDVTNFYTSGTFKYHCSIHPTMKGKVKVVITTSAVDPAPGDTFEVKWSSLAGIPSGFNVDVQIKKPGDVFKVWKTDQELNQVQGNFTPKKEGVFGFRARTQKGSNEDRASRWSPTLEITVLSAG